MKKIRLTRGKSAIVDDADFLWLSRWKWFTQPSRQTFYAVRKDCPAPGVYRHIRMHRQILGEKFLRKRLTDHRDGNGLNNQRFNLRPATKIQNVRNARRRRDNRSGFRGVARHRGKFMAQISIRGTTTYIGIFKCAKDAAKAYDRKARKLYGEFARLNFNA